MDLFPELYSLSSAFSYWNICSGVGTGSGRAGCGFVPSPAIGPTNVAAFSRRAEKVLMELFLFISI